MRPYREGPKQGDYWDEHLDFGWTWSKFQQRWTPRDGRHKLIDSVLRGDWEAIDDDDTKLENRSPNFIRVAMEDTSEAASIIPSVRVKPSDGTQDSKDKALKMERIGQSYLESSEISLLTIQSLMNLSAHGLFSWVIVPPEDGQGPRIEWRDPRTCYPEPDYSTLAGIKRCFFSREVYLTQLPMEYQLTFRSRWKLDQKSDCPSDIRVTLLEFYTPDCIVTGCSYESSNQGLPNGVSTQDVQVYAGHGISVSVIFEIVEHNTGVTPVVVGQRINIDPEPVGQFDQVTAVQQAHIRLTALSLDYADQAVYSETWVKDLIGELPTGGGSYINLGPNGSIGRVPPAVVGMTVFQELAQLVDNFHVAARWPKVRPGEVDQAIASAKFVEATAGMMNTVIRTYHLIMKQAFTKALEIAFKLDKTYGPSRTVSGIHRNQQFSFRRFKKDIDLEAVVSVEYGLGLGHDPAQSAVLGLQLAGAKIISQEFVQENFDGIVDVGRERERIDVEQLLDMLRANLLMGAQSGQIGDQQIIDLIKERQNGASFADAYMKVIAKPAEEAKSQMLQGGLGTATPGPAPLAGPEGGAAPPPPDAASLLGAIAGSGQPGPPESIGRLSVPLGGGGFAGTTQQSTPPPR